MVQGEPYSRRQASLLELLYILITIILLLASSILVYYIDITMYIYRTFIRSRKEKAASKINFII